MAVTAERADLSSQLSGAEAEVVSLKKKYDKSRGSVTEKEEALRLTRLELERVGVELRRCQEGKERVEGEYASQRDALEEARGKLGVCEEELEEKRRVCEERGGPWCSWRRPWLPVPHGWRSRGASTWSSTGS